MAEAVWLWGALSSLFLAVAALALPTRWLGAADDLARALAWRNRAVTAGIVLSFLFATRAFWPDPIGRAQAQYLFVITLGYGHLIGGAAFSRRRLGRLVPRGIPPSLFASFVLVSLVTLFAVYGLLINASTSLVLPLFAVSVWHIAENDVALEAAYRNRLQLEPLPRDLGHHALAVGAMALLLALSQATLEQPAFASSLYGTLLGEVKNGWMRALAIAAGAILCLREGLRGSGGFGFGLIVAGCLLPSDLAATPWPAFGDVFSAATLYHLVQWLVFFGDRSRRSVPGGRLTPAGALWRRIAWIHAAPAALCALLLIVPSNGPGPIAHVVFSPALYLYWSVLHVVQTALVRGLDAREPAGSGVGKAWA